MRTLFCALGWHQWIRHYTPGHLRLVCTSCLTETPGLRGPIVPAQPPVVKVRKLRPPRPAALRVVKPRGVRRMA